MTNFVGLISTKYFFGFVMVGYGIIGFFILREYINRIINQKKRFNTILVNGLRLSTINSLNDVVNIYVNIFRPGTENPRVGLNGVLQQFLVKLLENDLNQQIENDEIIEWKKIITEYICKNEEVSPYFDLPDAERTILNDMASFLDKNNNNEVQRKMKELAGIIKTKQDHLLRIEKTNKWSFPLAIIGIVLTLVFGVLSLK